MHFRDTWPQMADGRDFDGYNLLNLLHGGHSPFHDTWDVKLLIQEIEDKLSAQVVDIPHVSSGSNNYVSCDNFVDLCHFSFTYKELCLERAFT